MAAPVPELFDRRDPWTEEDFLALPVDRRVELVDGSLLVSPNARSRHQRMSFRVAAALDAAVPDGLEVLEAVNLRVGAGRILIPDIAVTSRPGLDVTVYDAADIVLVVEIAGPGSPAADRSIKPQLYAQAAVPHYLRIDLRHDGPHAFVFRLHRDDYAEQAHIPPRRPLALSEPIAVTLDLAALGAATRPSP